MAGIITPSYRSGFYSPERGAIPKYPELWDGCVGAWAPSLGPTGLTLRDQSGYSNHGTLTNMDPGTDWVVSGGAGALETAYTGSGLTTPHIAADITIPGPYSTSFWVYVTSFNSVNAGIWRTVGGGDFVIFQNTGRPWIRSSGADVLRPNTGYAVPLNQWVHCVFTLTTSATQFFANRQLQHSGSGGTYSSLSIESLMMQNAREIITGYYDDIRIYDRALPAAEIATLAQRRGIAYETAPRRNFFVAGGGGGLSIPVARHHYQMQLQGAF